MTEAAITHLKSADKTMARLIRQIGPCTIKRRQHTPYAALVQAVVYQQLNGTAAATIFGRVKAIYPGRRLPKPNQLLATPDDMLRKAGLSRNKLLALKDIAAKTIEGVIPSSRRIKAMSNEEIVERLTNVRGVGPWTVEMLLIFTLGREDVLPATDYGVRKGFAQTYGWRDLPKPKELIEFGERWKPHRTTAAWYLWRSLELQQAGNGQKKK